MVMCAVTSSQLVPLCCSGFCAGSNQPYCPSFGTALVNALTALVEVLTLAPSLLANRRRWEPLICTLPTSSPAPSPSLPFPYLQLPSLPIPPPSPLSPAPSFFSLLLLRKWISSYSLVLFSDVSSSLHHYMCIFMYVCVCVCVCLSVLPPYSCILCMTVHVCTCVCVCVFP